MPHLAFARPQAPCPPRPSASAIRQRLGVDPADFLFGVFGYLRESKRLMTVLEALAAASPGSAARRPAGGRPLRLERPGTRRGPAARADRASSACPISTSASFWLAAGAVDACINLRYPAAGESSGIAIRLMGLGKPVLVTDGEEDRAFLPEDACIRIPPGLAERDSRCAPHMILLTSANDWQRAPSASGAAAHIRRQSRG